MLAKMAQIVPMQLWVFIMGTAATIAAMTSITGQGRSCNGDYQRIYGVFSPATSVIYYLGIKGWININPWYNQFR